MGGLAHKTIKDFKKGAEPPPSTTSLSVCIRINQLSIILRECTASKYDEELKV